MTNVKESAPSDDKTVGNEHNNNDSKFATLTLPDGRVFKLPVLIPSVGPEVVCDVRNLYSAGKCLLYDPGFNSTASCASAITYVDGDAGVCLYRGHPVPDLVENGDFLDTCFLLLYGNRPSVQARKAFSRQVTSEMLIHNRLKDFVSTFVPGAHPMSILASTIAAMASFYADPMAARHIEDWEMRELACIRLVAKMPTIVAMSYKILMGEPMVYPRSDLSYSENFLNMMFSTPVSPYTVNPLHAKIIDAFLTIHADHEQNASTTTVRTAGSSLANPYACIATGVTSLWGRAHGGANEAAMEMLQQIGSVEAVPGFVERVKSKEARLMGFGHRVYRNYDPRAKIMQSLCDQLFADSKEMDPLYLIAKELEKIALNDDYFKSRHLYPNVDFYSGIVMRGLGIPHEMFTCMFTLGRTVGWLSHWKEMVEEGLIKIVRPRQLYLGPKRRDILQTQKDRTVSDAEDVIYSKSIADKLPFHVVQTEIMRGQPAPFGRSSSGTASSFDKYAAYDQDIQTLAADTVADKDESLPMNRECDAAGTTTADQWREMSRDSADGMMESRRLKCPVGVRKLSNMSPMRLDCRSPSRLRPSDQQDPGAHLLEKKS